MLHTYNRDTRSIYGEKRNRHHALAHVLPFKFGWQSIEQRLALIPHPRVNTTSIIGESNERNNKTLEGKDKIAPQLKAQLKCHQLREKLIHLQSAVEINPKTTQHSKHKTRLIDLAPKKKAVIYTANAGNRKQLRNRTVGGSRKTAKYIEGRVE